MLMYIHIKGAIKFILRNI